MKLELYHKIGRSFRNHKDAAGMREYNDLFITYLIYIHD